MKLPHISIIMNTISDISEQTILKLPTNMGKLRKHANILIIDDNEFAAEQYLKNNGYQIDHKYDINTIKEVEPYEIILCDISGVGKNLGYEKEGAFIIREIHANYPNKQIIAYTSFTYNADYNQFFSLADYVVPKDFAIDDWINLLDERVKKAIDPVFQWKKIRTYLLDNDISTITIAKIEDKYVQSVNDCNFNILNTYVAGKESKLSNIITDFISSLCAKIILGSIEG